MGWPEIVRTLRRHYGGKQESISLVVGASQATISRWESGRQIPGTSYRVKLLELYQKAVAQPEIATSSSDGASGIFDSNSIGMVKADAVRIMEANDTFLRMTGYSRDDLTSGAIVWPAMASAADAVAGRLAIRDLIRFGEFAPIETRLIRKDGGALRVLVAGMVVQRDPLQVMCSIIRLSDHQLARTRPRDEIRGAVIGRLAIPGALYGLPFISDIMQFLLP